MVALITDAVNGNWGSWGKWSACTEKVYCNKGVITRSRKCDSPAPKNGGDFCEGLGGEENLCPTSNCKGAAQPKTVVWKIVWLLSQRCLT